MAEPFIFTVEPPDEAVNNWILGGLVAFNRAEVNRPERQHFNVVLRDGKGIIKGGIIAAISFDVMRIDEFFVENDCRRGGHGSRLIEMAEEEARRRGARIACVMTFSWQARPFYEKQGYEVFGELPYQDGAYRLYWLKKRLCA